MKQVWNIDEAAAEAAGSILQNHHFITARWKEKAFCSECRFSSECQGQQAASLFGISEMAERKLNQLASGGRALTFASGYRWRPASSGPWNSLKETGRKGWRGNRPSLLDLLGKVITPSASQQPSLPLCMLAAKWQWHTLPRRSSWLLLQLCLRAHESLQVQTLYLV